MAGLALNVKKKMPREQSLVRDQGGGQGVQGVHGVQGGGHGVQGDLGGGGGGLEQNNNSEGKGILRRKKNTIRLIILKSIQWT